MSRTIRTATIVCAAVGAILLVNTALARPWARSVHGGGVLSVDIVTSTTPASTHSGEFGDLPGATVTISPDTQVLVVARFFAESNCVSPAGVTNRGACSVRILIGGVEGDPASGSEFVFDYVSGGGGPEPPGEPIAAAIERSRGPLGPGTYTIQVQMESMPDIFGGYPVFTVDDWSLSVESVAA